MGDHWQPVYVATLLWSRTLMSWFVILHDHMMIKTFRIRIRIGSGVHTEGNHAQQQNLHRKRSAWE